MTERPRALRRGWTRAVPEAGQDPVVQYGVHITRSSFLARSRQVVNDAWHTGPLSRMRTPPYRAPLPTTLMAARLEEKKQALCVSAKPKTGTKRRMSRRRKGCRTAELHYENYRPELQPMAEGGLPGVYYSRAGIWRITRCAAGIGLPHVSTTGAIAAQEENRVVLFPALLPASHRGSRRGEKGGWPPAHERQCLWDGRRAFCEPRALFCVLLTARRCATI